MVIMITLKKMPRAGAPFAHPIGANFFGRMKRRVQWFLSAYSSRGYVALGRVVTADNGKSKGKSNPRKRLCCVREDPRELVLVWRDLETSRTKNTYASKGDSKAQIPTIYNTGSVASGG